MVWRDDRFVNSTSAQVCVLNNIFAENKDIPKLCTCSFSRIRAIELMCANGEIYESYDCSKNICETCCTLSMSANELKPGDYPVSCKVRCINSPVASDVTEESRDLLSGLLRKINALYHPEPNKAKAPEEAVVPTKYHVIPLEEQHDDTF
uniref:Uncharacterized protein n=1 Tax=Babesia bovis TaxID=5865 RepID=S6AZU3_BABBO|nr:hypothetical protein [Babesia bovis]